MQKVDIMYFIRFHIPPISRLREGNKGIFKSNSGIFTHQGRDKKSKSCIIFSPARQKVNTKKVKVGKNLLSISIKRICMYDILNLLLTYF